MFNRLPYEINLYTFILKLKYSDRTKKGKRMDGIFFHKYNKNFVFTIKNKLKLL